MAPLKTKSRATGRSIKKRAVKQTAKSTSAKKPARKTAKKAGVSSVETPHAQSRLGVGRTVSVTSAAEIIRILDIEPSVVTDVRRALH